MKGIVYSVIVMVILTPIIISSITYLGSVRTYGEEITVKIRGNEFSNFANSISYDLPRIVDITGKTAITAAVNYVDINGSGIDNSELRLKELVLQETIYSQKSPSMNTSPILTWINRTISKGRDYGFESNIRIESLEIRQYDSFNIAFDITLTVNITDRTGKMEINRRFNRTVLVSIEGFDDPLYTLETNGYIKRKIKRNNLTIYGISTADYAIQHRFYMACTDGPEFLDRLEGKFTPSEKGIETFVDLSDLSIVGIPVNTGESIIDHQYFDLVPDPGNIIAGSSYSWFKLDDEHRSLYGL